MGESERKLSRERMEARGREGRKRLEGPEQGRALSKTNVAQHAFAN